MVANNTDTRKTKLSLGELPTIDMEDIAAELDACDSCTKERLNRIADAIRHRNERQAHVKKLDGIAERLLQDCQTNGLYRHEFAEVMARAIKILDNQLITID